MITIALVVITCIISYLAWNKPGLLQQLCHHPYLESTDGQYYRLLSAGFVHGSWSHLGINMFVLFQFGQVVEYRFAEMYGPTWANLMYIIFYLTAIVVANLGTLVKHRSHSGFTSVGASGVTSAIIFMYSMFDPWQMFLWPPLPAIVLAVGYVAYSTWAGKNKNDGIDHLAHLYGGIYGIVFLFATHPESFKIFTYLLVNDTPW